MRPGRRAGLGGVGLGATRNVARNFLGPPSPVVFG